MSWERDPMSWGRDKATDTECMASIIRPDWWIMSWVRDNYVVGTRYYVVGTRYNVVGTR